MLNRTKINTPASFSAAPGTALPHELALVCSPRTDVPWFMGCSESMQHVHALISHIAPTEADMLIHGETGTGKEIIARYIHQISGRTGAFVTIDCGAIPEAMFESELFGHEAGAFNNAYKKRIGKLEHACHGTVFLDEIEAMPVHIQVKLLRVLQERQIEPIGSNHAIPIHCRFITASKADLRQLSQTGSFREDLFYRISVVSIDIPSLSQRSEDIPGLLAHFIQQAVHQYQRPYPHFTQAQMKHWQTLSWPGNVRELKNFAERLVLGIPAQLPSACTSETSISLPEKVSLYEKTLITQALHANQYNVSEAALQLKIPKKTLYDKLKKNGIHLRTGSAATF